MNSNENIIVLGAGLAGLGFCRTLPGVRIFEANSHPGGQAYSHDVQGYFFDRGAHISHSKDPQFLNMTTLDAGDVHQIKSSKVGNYWHGRWMNYPIQSHLNELPTAERIKALSDLIMAHINPGSKTPGNYADWCLNQYGEYLTNHFYREFTEKYWRLSMHELATDWLGGRLIPAVIPNIIRGAFANQTEQETSFAQFRYPAHGGFFGFFRSLFDEINIQFRERAIEIDTQKKEVVFESGKKEYYETLASSIPLPEIISIIKDVPPAVLNAAKLLRYTKILCVNIIVGRPNLSPYHWCYVYDTDIHPSRISFPVNFSPMKVNQTISSLQAEFFRRNDEDWDVTSIAETTVKQMGKLFNFDTKREIMLTDSFVIPYAYIISDLNRKKAVNCILTWLEQEDIFGMGLYGRWEYVWSDFAYKSGVETANKIKKRLCL